MSDEDLFHAAIRGSGGRLPRDRFTKAGFESTYGHILDLAGGLIQSARDHVPGLPLIHFDFILNGNFNACAFQEQGRYFIGYNTGTQYLLQLVFFRMLADPRLFDFIGDPAGELQDPTPLVRYAADAEQMYRAGLVPLRPRGEARWAYACELVRRATTFLVGHEIAHITRGHVGYLQSVTGHGFIAEVGWRDTGAGGTAERQALEADADARSTQSAMATAALTHADRDRDPSHFMATRTSVEDLLFDWAFAMNTVFRLFGDVRFDPATAGDPPYPPEPLRRFMATITAHQYVVHGWDAGLHDTAIRAFKKAALYTELSFMVILGQEWGAHGLRAFGGDGVEHYLRLRDHWSQVVGPRVAPFAYERDRAAPAGFAGGGVDDATVRDLLSSDPAL